MSMLTWYAMDEADRIRRQLDRLFEPISGSETFGTRVRDYFSAPAQVWETSESYIVKVMLPGVNADSLDVEAHPRRLTISGKASLTGPEDAALLQNEFGDGDFQRTWKFPRPIATDRVQAHQEDGLLTVTLPKEEVSQTVKVTIGNGKSSVSTLEADSESAAELTA